MSAMLSALHKRRTHRAGACSDPQRSQDCLEVRLCNRWQIALNSRPGSRGDRAADHRYRTTFHVLPVPFVSWSILSTTPLRGRCPFWRPNISACTPSTAINPAWVPLCLTPAAGQRHASLAADHVVAVRQFADNEAMHPVPGCLNDQSKA